MPNYQAGGSFLPSEPVNFTNNVNFAIAPTSGTDASSAFVTSTGTQTLTNKTLTAPTVTAPVISGAATLASGATLTTPTILFTAQNVVATGATGTTAAALSAVTPVLVNANSTGVSGAGLALPTGAAVPGAAYFIKNSQTGVVNIYAVGGTINGTTGTTAFALTATGNLTALVMCVVAGAWQISGNT